MTRWESAQTILASSEQVRDDLIAAAQRLDAYIEMLRAQIPAREDGDLPAELAGDDRA